MTKRPGGGSVWPAEPDLVANACRGDGTALAELFARRMSACAKPYVHGECFTHGPFSDLFAPGSGLTGETAFLLVPVVIDLIRSEQQVARIECALSLLSELVQATSTTEIPERLNEHWDDVAEIARRVSPLALSFWENVVNWYRRAAHQG